MYLLVILASFARLSALTHDIIIASYAPMVRNEVEFPLVRQSFELSRLSYLLISQFL